VAEARSVEDGPTRGPATGAPSEDVAAWRHFAQATTVGEFYRGWLNVQCRLLSGVVGAVVLGVDGGRLQTASPLAVWGNLQRSLRPLTEVAQRALAQHTRIVAAHDVDTVRRYAVAFPVQARGLIVGVMALELGPRPEPELEAALRQLEWGSGWLEALALRQSTAGEASAARERLQTVLDLVASAQGHARFAEAATTFVTELATRLSCDRVSIGFVRRGRARVSAVSHTAHLGRRSNLLQAIGAAMDEAIDQKAPVVTPSPSGVTPRVSRAHDELARHGAGSTVYTVPFVSGRRIVGAITFERPADRPFDQLALDLIEAVAGLAGPGLEILRREDRWLVIKAIDAARGTLAGLLGPGELAFKLAAIGVLAALAFVFFAKGDYRVTARALMEPSVRRVAVAPFGGYVREAPVRAGDLVRAGQVLVVLDDRELRLERAKLESQREQLDRQRALALAQGNAAQINIARAQIDQATARIGLIEEQLGKTRVVAGFDGVVVTGDLSQSLGVPVDKGQVLFEIAPLGAYRLVVQVDERDINDVTVGGRGRLLLAAAPADPLPFTVERIVPVSVAREGRNFFRVEGRLEQTPERLRPGMEGVAKIDVDRRLLATIWTRSARDSALLTLWTWWP
jgi:RND family efflux transporter MFP subunit